MNEISGLHCKAFTGLLLVTLGIGPLGVLYLLLRLWLPPDKHLTRARLQQKHDTQEVTGQQGRAGPVLTQLWPREEAAETSKIDIIAIHELDTQSPTTWEAYRNHKDRTDGVVHWLKDDDMLHARFPQARIFTYDWPATTYRHAVEDEIVGHASTLLNRVQNRDNPDRPLIFIASCFGGLLLSKAITLASNITSEHHTLLKSISGILFLGTPFGKSDAGSAAHIRVRIAKTLGGESCNKLVRYLVKHNNELNEMVQEFEQILHSDQYQIGVRCYYETKRSQIYGAILPAWIVAHIPYGKMILVPADSARIGGFPLEPMTVKHALLNKYFGPNDPNFETICGGVGQFALKTELSNIDAVLKRYYERNSGKHLRIERLSGKFLPMENCYINLCMVSHNCDFNNGNDVKGTGNVLRAPTSGFTLPRSSLTSQLKVETPATANQVTLQTLFTRRKRRDGTICRPNRVLIWGCAGVGKTTLCKKIVHDFVYRSLWKDLFARVLWLPLRELKLDRSHTLTDFLSNKFLSAESENSFVKRNLRNLVGGNGTQPHNQHGLRTLLILDGLDEINFALGSDHRMERIFEELLEHEDIIITSRPHVTNILHDKPPDLELETIGFYPEQIDQYLENECTEAGASVQTISEIRSFIRNYPVVQSLARIPIQLDAICYSWSNNFVLHDHVSMTMLYRKIELKLWEKYLTSRGPLSSEQVHDSPAVLDKVNEGDEIEFLSKLAFCGLNSHVIEFGTESIRRAQRGLKPIFNDNMIQLPFIRSSDNSIEFQNRTYHFIHLTFQEYFAARYFVRHWRSDVNVRFRNGSASKPEAGAELEHPSRTNRSFQTQYSRAAAREEDETLDLQSFLQAEKYNARYNIFWRFVSGLLGSENCQYLCPFFELIESEPRDIIGLVHQRLIMQCLNEVSIVDGNFKAKTEALERRYLNWVLFEYEFTSTTNMGVEVECPKRIIKTILAGNSKSKQVGMEILSRRRNISNDLLISVLHELIGSSDSGGEVINRACQVLGAHCSPTSDQQLINFWQNLPYMELTQRRFLIDSLHSCDVKQPAIDAMMRLLEDEDGEVQDTAAVILSKQDLSNTCIEPFLRTIGCETEDKEERIRLTRILASQRQLPDKIVRDLARMFGSTIGNDEVYSEVAEILLNQAELPGDVVEVFVQLLMRMSTEDQGRDRLAEAISHQKLTNRAVGDLIQILQAESPDQEMQSIAATILGSQFHLPDSAIQALGRLLEVKSIDRRVKILAAYVLRCRVFLLDQITEILIQLLKDDGKEKLQLIALKILVSQMELLEPSTGGQPIPLRSDDCKSTDGNLTRIAYPLGQLFDTLIEKLVQSLRCKNKECRVFAKDVLSRCMSLSISTFGKMVQLLDDQDFEVRVHAYSILRLQCQLPNRLVGDLVQLIEHQDDDTRFFAARALRREDQLSEKAIADLVQLFEHPDDGVQRYALYALCDQVQLPDMAIEGLLRLLKDHNYASRYHAALLLAKHGWSSEVFIEALIRLLHNSTRFVEYAAPGIFDVYTHSVEVEPHPMLSLDPYLLTSCHVEAILEHDELYRPPSTINSPVISQLLKYWLLRSFEDHIACSIVGNTLLLNANGTARTISLKEEQLEAFRSAARELQERVEACLVQYEIVVVPQQHGKNQD